MPDGPVVLTRSASNREGEDLAPLPADLKIHSAKVSLYEFNQSPPCWKVRALLHYYGVEYESIVTYPGSKVEGLDNAYAKIPKLTIDDIQVNDSAVIYRTLAPLLAGEPLTEKQIEVGEAGFRLAMATAARVPPLIPIHCALSPTRIVSSRSATTSPGCSAHSRRKPLEAILASPTRLAS